MEFLEDANQGCKSGVGKFLGRGLFKKDLVLRATLMKNQELIITFLYETMVHYVEKSLPRVRLARFGPQPVLSFPTPYHVKQESQARGPREGSNTAREH